MRERLGASILDGDCAARCHSYSQRRRETADTAIENKFLHFRRRIGLRHRIDTQKSGVRLARGKIMAAGAVKRQTAREVGILFSGQDFDMSPSRLALLHAAVPQEGSEGKGWVDSGFVRVIVE